MKGRTRPQVALSQGPEPRPCGSCKRNYPCITGHLFPRRREVGSKSQTELHQASARQKGKPAGRAPGRRLPRPGGGAPLPARHRIAAWVFLPSLPDRYLVEMRVPGDIVPALLQGHGARRAGLGVAASGARAGRPAPGGAAGLAVQENRPRACAQRGAHGPCADLAPGRRQGQGACRAAGTPRAAGHPVCAGDASSGPPQGSRRGKAPAPAPPQPPPAQRPVRRLRWAPGEAKASPGSRSGAGDCPRHPRPRPRPEGATARRGAPERPAPRVSRLRSPPGPLPELRSPWPRCGAGGRGAAVRCSPPADGRSALAAASTRGWGALERAAETFVRSAGFP